MVLLILLFYLIGAFVFWSSYKSESLIRDFLLGLVWPVALPSHLVFAALEKQRTKHVKAQADREAELRAWEERFIGHGASTGKWMAEEVTEGEDAKRSNEIQERP